MKPNYPWYCQSLVLFIIVTYICCLKLVPNMPVALPPYTMNVVFHQLFDLELPVSIIAKEHGVSERVVRKWRLNWRVIGSALPGATAKIGRPRATTLDMELALLEWLNEGRPDAYLNEMAWYL
jgi:hypothetical protein